MTDEIQAQIDRRMPVMEFLSKAYAEVDGVVIGVALVIEYIDADGHRDLHKMTSDAGGKPMPPYLVDGISHALDYLDEFDEYAEGVDE